MDTIGIITKAARSNKLVEITYRDKKGVTTVRITEPYSIKDNKYFGFCKQKQGMRSFIINGISSCKELDMHYTPRWPIEF